MKRIHSFEVQVHTLCRFLVNNVGKYQLDIKQLTDEVVSYPPPLSSVWLDFNYHTSSRKVMPMPLASQHYIKLNCTRLLILQTSKTWLTSQAPSIWTEPRVPHGHPGPGSLFHGPFATRNLRTSSPGG